MKNREYVVSGLDAWRTVIKEINETLIWKYVCCDGECIGSDYKPSNNEKWAHVLFEIVSDPLEQHDLHKQYPDIVKEMNAYMPPGFCGNNP